MYIFPLYLQKQQKNSTETKYYCFINLEIRVGFFNYIFYDFIRSSFSTRRQVVYLLHNLTGAKKETLFLLITNLFLKKNSFEIINPRVSTLNKIVILRLTIQ